jgi:hypothetical protein
MSVPRHAQAIPSKPISAGWRIHAGRDRYVAFVGMCAITVGGPWEGRNHPPAGSAEFRIPETLRLFGGSHTKNRRV